MSRNEARKILCKQLELLAEVSKEVSKTGDASLLPELSRAMISLYRTLFTV